jgi:hypothetical protein
VTKYYMTQHDNGFKRVVIRTIIGAVAWIPLVWLGGVYHVTWWQIPLVGVFMLGVYELREKFFK